MPGLLRTRDGHEARVATIELFFDLVFVFAVTQLSHMLLANQTLAGAGQTLILFLGIWWVWIYTSWVTNWLDPTRLPVRLLLFALMGAGLFLSMAIPEAWDGGRGLVFAVAYAAMQVGRSVFMLFALRRHNRANFLNFCRISIWLAVSGTLWIAGGLASPEDRLPYWLAAVLIEYAGPASGFRVPGLGRSSTHDWDVEGGHIAERCGLFIIIALGESILITGATFAEVPWNAPTIAGFLAAFLGTVGMWWLYFNIGAERAGHRITHSDDPGRIARIAYTYVHLLIVGGIIVSAAADEIVLAHPEGHPAPSAATTILAGPLLYLAGSALFKRVTAGWWPLSHLVGLWLILAILAAALLFAPHVTPLLLGIATSVTIVVVAIWEGLSLRDNPNLVRLDD